MNSRFCQTNRSRIVRILILTALYNEIDRITKFHKCVYINFHMQ